MADSVIEPVPVSPVPASIPSADRLLMHDMHCLSHEMFRLGRQMITTSWDSLTVPRHVRLRAVKAMRRDALEIRAAAEQILRAADLLAQAIEARRAATGTGAVHESAVRQDAPNPNPIGDNQ